MIKYGPYSSSRVEISHCPYRFTREYIRKDCKKSHSEFANRGSAIHYAFEKITKAFASNKKLEDIESLITEAFEKYPVYDQDNLEFIKQAIYNYNNEENRPFSPNNIVDVELKLGVKKNFSPCDYHDPEVFFRGIIDILEISNDSANIIDHKSQMHIESPNTFQMGAYALLVKAHYPYLSEIKTTLHFHAPSLNFYSYPAKWDDYKLKNLLNDLKRFIKLAEAIEDNNRTEAIPGKYCQYCPVIADCPIIAKVSNGEIKMIGPIGNAETAREFAKALTALDEFTSQAKKQLKNFMESTGASISLGDSEYQLRTYKNKNYDNPEEVIKILKEYNLNINNFVNINNAKLNEIGKKNTDISNKLEMFSYSDVAVKMGCFKNKIKK